MANNSIVTASQALVKPPAIPMSLQHFVREGKMRDHGNEWKVIAGPFFRNVGGNRRLRDGEVLVSSPYVNAIFSRDPLAEGPSGEAKLCVGVGSAYILSPIALRAVHSEPDRFSVFEMSSTHLVESVELLNWQVYSMLTRGELEPRDDGQHKIVPRDNSGKVIMDGQNVLLVTISRVNHKEAYSAAIRFASGLAMDGAGEERGGWHDSVHNFVGA